MTLGDLVKKFIDHEDANETKVFIINLSDDKVIFQNVNNDKVVSYSSDYENYNVGSIGLEYDYTWEVSYIIVHVLDNINR